MMVRALSFVLLITSFAPNSTSAATAEVTGSSFAKCHLHGLIRLKSAIMRSDYRGDLKRLDEAAARADRYADDAACAGPAAYWQGYAHWRHATNSANEPSPSRTDIAQRLDKAAIALRAAVEAMPDDLEAKIALMGVVQMRPLFEEQGSDSWRNAILETRKLLAELEPIASDNPRFLWLRGGMHFWAPAPLGAGPDAAIELYRKGLAVAHGDSSKGSGLTPGWGKPELLMSIGYVAANRPDPDLALAEEQVRVALKLQPDWHYARDILLPDILKRRAAKGN